MTKAIAGYALTPDIAWAVALDTVYGLATSPSRWDNTEDREDAFWTRLRDLLGNPSEDDLRAMLWGHRETIARMNQRVIASRTHGYALTQCEIDSNQPIVTRELPL